MQLNIEQRKLIQSKPGGHNLIRGVAGSGKTTVAVHRILFLLNNYCRESDDNILLLTYNKMLVNYINHIYSNLEKEETIQENFLNKSNIKPNICTVDSLIFKYFNKFKNRTGFKYDMKIDIYLMNNTLKESIVELNKSYSDVEILDVKNLKFLSSEIDWIKSCNYMELSEYQNVDRIGRMSSIKGESSRRLNKNSRTREAIFYLMQLYDRRLMKKGYIDFKTMALLALEEIKREVLTKYTHIIVDECQDLTRVQLEFIRLLSKDKHSSSILLAADTAQSIYAHAWLTKGRSYASIGFDVIGRSNVLAKNYRTTTQISEAAYSLLERDTNITEDNDFVKPSLIDRQGKYPVYRAFRNIEEEGQYIVDTVRNLVSKKYKLNEIVILAKNNNQLYNIKTYLDKAQISCDITSKADSKFDKDYVKLLTIHSMKGLESKVVIIVGINSGIIPYISYQNSEDEEIQESMERKLLYVGMTRANELLYMTSSGVPSKFIGDIKEEYLKMNLETKMSRYYMIDMDKYLFKENIVDIYSKEESVRQYVINELIQTYKYPEKLISVEYKINSFSKMGFADIVISKYKNNTKIPYIIIETKAYGAGICEAESQLKSYMSNLSSCEYGIACDGNQILIINNKFEKVEDIPMFEATMLQSTLENYIYLDLKHNNKYTMTKDITIKDYLYVKNEVVSEEYTKDTLKPLTMYNDIAAGQPIYMCAENSGEFYLPKEWLSKSEDTFILKVRGDSMINANINNRDYVVIEKSQTVENMQIAAVAIDENATLKRVMKMGDTVLLIAENKDYEPIQVRSDQINIIGLAVGVIKRVSFFNK